MAKDNLTSREKQALKTKEKLFKSAIKLFNEKGYNQVTIDEIVSKAGTSKGTFYIYFSSKSEVIMKQFKEIDNHYLEFTNNLSNYQTATEKLLAFVENQLKFTQEALGVNTVKILYSSQLNNEVEKIIIDKSRPLYTVVQEIVEEGQATGEFRNNISAEEMTELLIRCMRSIFFEWGIYNGNFDFVEEGCKFFSDFLANGFLNKDNKK